MILAVLFPDPSILNAGFLLIRGHSVVFHSNDTLKLIKRIALSFRRLNFPQQDQSTTPRSHRLLFPDALDQLPFSLLTLLATQDLDRLAIPDITQATPQRGARDQVTPALKHPSQIPRGNHGLRQHGQQHGVPHEQQLQ